jgi:hypothetical protein
MNDESGLRTQRVGSINSIYTVLAFTVLILNRHPERPLSEPALSPAGE